MINQDLSTAWFQYSFFYQDIPKHGYLTSDNEQNVENDVECYLDLSDVKHPKKRN